ncbi:MAG: hypothetical protein V3V67_13505 [Myxococcota bacterium]
MSRHETLIRELARDLRPVVRLPRLRGIAAAVAGTAGLAAGLYVGVPVLLGGAVEAPGRLEVTIGSSHVVLAAGAVLLALASAVPGRRTLERVGLAGACLGAALVLLSVPAVREAALAGLGSGAVCALKATLLALVPAAVLLRFVAAAEPFSPSRTLLFGAVGALSLGALPVHLACPLEGSLHWLVGHSLAPLTGGVLLFVALRLFYRPVADLLRSD